MENMGSKALVQRVRLFLDKIEAQENAKHVDVPLIAETCSFCKGSGHRSYESGFVGYCTECCGTGSVTSESSLVKSVVSAKPPIGIKPKYIHDSERFGEVLRGVERYRSAGKKIPSEWIDELINLLLEVPED